MDFEYVFNGSVDEFFETVRIFRIRRLSAGESNRYYWIADTEVLNISERNMVLLWDGVRNQRTLAFVYPQSLRAGTKCLLKIHFPENKWDHLNTYWESLEAELRRLEKLINKDDGDKSINKPIEYGAKASKTSKPKETWPKEELMVIIQDTLLMRQFYKYYSPVTAKGIIEKIPTAWRIWIREGGRWGPGTISELHPLSAATIGRYIGAFKKAGIMEIEGSSGEKIPLPPNTQTE